MVLLPRPGPGAVGQRVADPTPPHRARRIRPVGIPRAPDRQARSIGQAFPDRRRDAAGQTPQGVGSGGGWPGGPGESRDSRMTNAIVALLSEAAARSAYWAALAHARRPSAV